MDSKFFFKLLLFIVMILFTACEYVSYPIGGGNGSYTIYFDTDGGDYCSSKNGYYGDEIVLPLPYKFGYTFQGWYSSSGSYYGMDGDAYRITSSITLYARWGNGSLQTYRISFDSQGGTYCSDRTANYSENITLPSTSRSGYSFAGWYSSPNGNGTYYGSGGENYRVYSDATMYAYWIWGNNCPVPFAPTEISARAYYEKEIRVSWSHVSGADYYEIYRSDYSNNSYYLVGDSYANSFTDYDPNFYPQTYYYKVKAVNSCGESVFSNAASETIFGGGGTGTLVIKNTSYSYNITDVYIGGVNHGSIPKNSSNSYKLSAGNYDIKIYDDYPDENYNNFTTSVSIIEGKTATLTYDGYGF